MNKILREILGTDNSYSGAYMTELYKFLINRELVMEYHMATVNMLTDDSDKYPEAYNKICELFQEDERDFIDELVSDYLADCGIGHSDNMNGY